MKLDVYVGRTIVGILEQVDLTRFVFTYLPGADDDKMVSLLMPVRTESWVHRFLHPVFQVSLPEGSVRQLLMRRFAKHFKHFGDTELLATIGSHLVGRLKVTPHGAPLQEDAPAENLRELLKESSQELIDHYVGEHIQYSGVSGGFPKFLARSPVGDDDSPKSTLIFDHWIIKLNDTDHPHLVLNEYFGMSLARRMDLPVPEFHLSDDGTRIAIRRFDFTPTGNHVGFEDMAAMMGLNASDKFSGSVERIVKTINGFCKPLAAQTSREQFFAQYLACSAIRNGDAHLKNFGLLYTTWEDVHLAPVYDMVSMGLYAPRAQNGDALDEPALSLGGVKRWLTEKSIKELGSRCMVPAAKQAEIVARLCLAMSETADEMHELIKDGPEGFAPIGKRMLELWSHGIRVHNPGLADRLLELSQCDCEGHIELAPTA
ncbi:type II toxin-antitoxin system HipA family toxin [Polaromonas sp.]|uniref:type II toxin-antitoxin system HipA family toxin n=1 Tax=Polaromonas sp. TaxID=1869339 RepID=UPI00352A4B7C